MSINSRILDGLGQGYEARVDKFHSLWVRDIGIPPTNDPNNPDLNFNEIQTVYREFLTLNGDGTTKSMIVDGTLAVPKNFYITAEPNVDIYVTSLSLFLSAPNQKLKDWGGYTDGLLNGIKIYYEGANGQIVVGNEIKTAFEFVRLAQGNPSFVDSSAAPFIASNVSGSSEGFFQVLDFSKTFGLPYGVRLNTSTVNKVVLQIRDSIANPGVGRTPPLQFDVIAYGTRVKIT